MNLSENISEIIQLSKSKIAKDSAIVLAGRILGAGLGFLATVLITRTLGPVQFGIFSVAVAVMAIAAQFSDFGISTSLVRFVSLFLKKKDTTKANLTLKVALKFKLIVASTIFLIGFFVSESLAVHVFGKPELIFPLKLAFIGAFGASLVAYISATLQARQSFKKFMLFNLINPLGKFALIGLLFLTYKLNLFSALTTVIILPFIAFLIGSLIIPKEFLRAKGDENEALHGLFHFSKWILVSVLCMMVFRKLDILMLGYFESPEVIGYYSAAFTSAFALFLVIDPFIMVLLPELSKITEKERLRAYIKKSTKFMLLIALLLGLPLFIFSDWFIPFIYGGEYTNSIIIFKILLFVPLLVLITNPITLGLYSINKPNVESYTNMFRLSLALIGNLILIPLYGAIGAAIATLLTWALGEIVIVYYIYKQIGVNK